MRLQILCQNFHKHFNKERTELSKFSLCTSIHVSSTLKCVSDKFNCHQLMEH